VSGIIKEEITVRKLLLICLIVVIAVPSVFAARKKVYAGKVSDYVYTDKKYDFSLNLNEEWKYKIKKNSSDFRLVLTKIDYPTPPEYASAPDYTKIPKMVVYVVQTDLAPRAFVDSLLSDDYKSKAKKEIMKECEILNLIKSTGFVPERLVTRKKKSLKIDERKGFYWTGQAKYTNEVSTSASSIGGKRVKGGFGGTVVVVKDGENMILFHAMSEWNYFETLFTDAMKIIETLKFK